MTHSPARPCKRPGCPNITNNKDGYCDEHREYGREQIRKTRPPKQTNRFYNTVNWQRAREAYGKRNPLCEDCYERGIIKPKDMVDHIHEIKDGGAKLDPTNFRSLCWGCHAKKTAREKRERDKTYED